MGHSLLIVDDHEGVATALAQLLGGWGCDPVHVARTADEAVALADRVRPELLTVDADLGRDDGIELVARLRVDHPRRPIIVLTASGTPEVAAASLRAGASAFVSKADSSDALVAAIEAALAGDMWIPPKLLGPVVGLLLQPAPPNDWQVLIDTLSAREREVLELMVRGLSRREIASTLCISLNTVRTHVKNILAKLGVHAGLEAVSLALRAGIRPTDGPGQLSGAGAPRG